MTTPLSSAGAEQFADVAHVNDYFGYWAIEEQQFRAALSKINGMDIRAHVTEVRDGQPEPKADGGVHTSFPERVRTVSGGIAIIDLVGPLMKQDSSLSGGTSTVRARRQIRQAANSEDIRGILLRIDSPGGTVAGTADLADDIKAALRQKPIHAFIEDLGASAAYWLASQTARITVTRTSLIGSIGTFAVIVDSLKAHADAGFEVHVIRAGEFKGAGTPGTEVTDKQLAEMQRIVDGLNNHFIEAVAAGRSLSNKRVRELADGRVHVGQGAVAEKLADVVGSIDEAVANLRSEIDAGPKIGSERRESIKMSQQVEPAAETATEIKTPAAAVVDPNASTAIQPASYEDLKAACAGADATFICKQLEGKATVQQATTAWMTEQNQRIAESNKKIEEAKVASAAGEPIKTAGGYGPGAVAGGAGDAASRWNEAIDKEMSHGMNRMKAALAVDRKFPTLRSEMIAAANAA